MSASSSSSSTPGVVIGPDQVRALDVILDQLDTAALHWVSGYAAGLAKARLSTTTSIAAVTAPATKPVTVLFGTHTGNSRKVAEQLATSLATSLSPTSVRTVSAGAFNVRTLADERVLVIAIATHGDGDPPDDARALYDFIMSKRAPKLPLLRYAVIGLGDSSYPKFCSVARALDERLAELGATRLIDRVDCDVDYAADAARFVVASHAAVVARHQAEHGTPALASVTPLRSAPSPVAEPRLSTATVVANQRLTARGTTKDVRHIELALDDDIVFAPGDALLVDVLNDDRIVDETLKALRLDGDTSVERNGDARSLREWLRRLEVTRLSKPTLLAHAQRIETVANREAFEAQLSSLSSYVAPRQWADVLVDSPAAWTAADFVATLRLLPPRAYSIASSLAHAPNEAHLTVSLVDDRFNDRQRLGAASTFLGAQAIDDAVTVRVQENTRFRLPADDVDVIFIGPGTGVAPFRSFLQEREARGASGKSWLFFGEQTLVGHFLYQTEWAEARRRGALHRLDVAFSRDQANKIYVQDRLRERAHDLWSWLQDGAVVYVCGDAKRMAPDVERALLDIARSAGHLDDDGAADWLADLSAAHRYRRDVY